MKKWFCLTLVALLIIPALAEEGGNGDYMEEDRNIRGAQQLEINEVYYLDLDGDGEEEIIRARMQDNVEEENLTLQVETDELIYSYYTYIIFEEAAYAADLDGDGRIEILLTGDEASADYFTWCLKFSREEGLQPIKFADANRGENTDDYFECGYGRLDAIDETTITLTGSQDALGTWMCSRQFTLRDGRFELYDDGIWHVNENYDDPEVWEYRCLTTTRELPITMEDGTRSILPVGTSFLVTETDKKSFVGVRTKEGELGKISVEPNTEEGWGFLIDGESEYDYFAYIPYAD